ncbi:MAG: phosphatase PAP2 family protein [Campylobacterota bacterium]|nr:phosphatase PAP2 family protein [Campylobacterota bacterium]
MSKQNNNILASLVLSLLFITSSYAKDENVEHYGDIIQILIPATGYATTIYLDDEEGEDQFWNSFLSTFGTTHVLKRTVKEERPNDGNDQSFPSGHTSASFQGATFIHQRYGLKYAIPAYIGATFVGYSRVYAEKHYTHDVVAGALIGSGFSYYFTTPYKYRDVSIKPIVYNSVGSKSNLYGVQVTW